MVTSGVRSRYFLRDGIDEWGEEPQRTSQVLAWVTASTNMARLRMHVRPEGVIQLSTCCRPAAPQPSLSAPGGLSSTVSRIRAPAIRKGITVAMPQRWPAASTTTP